MGRPLDQLVVGRWACDGRGLPALFRPATGDVYRFDVWASAADGDPTATVEHGLPIGGQAILVRRGDCDRIEVRAP